MNPVKLILLSDSHVRVIYDTGKEKVFKARGILMKPWGIQATLEGSKTQTRRIRFYGKPGELLYIKEAFYEYGYNEIQIDSTYKWRGTKKYKYSEDKLKSTMYFFWLKKSPLFMPRVAARYWLLIEDVREERLQDISIADCLREGITNDYCKICAHRDCYCYPKCKLINSCNKAQSIKPEFIKLWDFINGNRRDKHGNRLPYAWADNPVVYVITYRLFFQGRGVVE